MNDLKNVTDVTDVAELTAMQAQLEKQREQLALERKEVQDMLADLEVRRAEDELKLDRDQIELEQWRERLDLLSDSVELVAVKKEAFSSGFTFGFCHSLAEIMQRVSARYPDGMSNAELRSLLQAIAFTASSSNVVVRSTPQVVVTEPEVVYAG